MPTIHTFGPFRLDAEAEILFRGAEPVALGRRAVALLRVLIEHHGEPVLKDALIESAWSGLAVEDSNLTVQIAALRRVLGDQPGGEQWIETLPRRGYRFVGPAPDGKGGGALVAVVPARAHLGLARALQQAPRTEAERRQLTVMSCELIGAATRTGLDLEDLREVIGVYQCCVAETVGRFNGYVDRHVGNIVQVYFGYPAAHEDDAERAVRAGLEVCAAVRDLDAGVSLRCRVGVAAGLVIIGDLVGVGEGQEHGIVGDAPNMASRLQAWTEPDTVAIEQNTRRLIGEFFDCRELGTIEVAGVAEPAPIWQVLRPSMVESRFEALRAPALTPLVGREEELELLQRRWVQAKKGEGRVVLVSGEPGIGKSRIAQALQDLVQSEPHVRLRYFCSPHHTDSALYPVTQHLQHAAGIARDDSIDEKLAKLEGLIARSGITAGDHAPLLAELLSIPSNGRYPPLDLSPQRQKARTLACLLELLTGFAARQPLLVTFEDAHWSDPTSRELLDLTVNVVQSFPVLLIVTFRPEFTAPWIGHPHVSVHILSRLGRRDAESLVAAVIGDRSLPRDVLNHIIARTDGVPLFIEELTKSILESELVTGGMQQGIAGTVALGAVPNTLHGSLMMRLDRLGPGREVAQMGAALGRQFSFELMSAIAQMPDDRLRQAFQELVDAQLVFCRGAPPDAEFTFKHALVQDAAYATLLKGRRIEIHRRIAEAICDRFPALAETRPEIVAHHLTQAGQSESAVSWWITAGMQGLQRSNFFEAIAHLEKAISLTEGPAAASVPRSDRLRLQIAYGQAMIPAYGHAAPETTKAFARARELLTGIENPAERYSVSYGLWVGSYLRGELAPMSEVSQLGLEDSEGREGSAESCVAHRIAGTTCWWQGDYVAARDHFEQAAAAYDFGRDRGLAFNFFGQDVGVCATFSLAMVLWPLGEISRALQLVEQAVDLAFRSEHTPTIAWAHCHRCFFEAARGNATRAKLDAEALVTLGQERDLPQWVAYGTSFQGWSQWGSGAGEAGLAELRRGIGLLRKYGIVAFVPLLRGLLARAEAQRGNVRTAQSILDDALGEVRQTGEVRYEAELCRQRAELLPLRGSDDAGAEKLLMRALSIARQQQTKLFELRAATGLAKRWLDQGRRDEARDLVVPIYNWFCDRSEEEELKETAALLDALQ
jgi:class 3 adenylate cyclase/DNA-binding winged helix-turn-helix (wHTH) protein/predicted ATPase